MQNRIIDIARANQADPILKKMRRSFNQSKDKQKQLAVRELESDINNVHDDMTHFQGILRILDFAKRKQEKYPYNQEKHFPAALYQVATTKLVSMLVPMYLNSQINQDVLSALWDGYFHQLDDAGKALACHSIATSLRHIHLTDRKGSIDKTIANILHQALSENAASTEDRNAIKYKYLGNVLPMYASQIKLERNRMGDRISYEKADSVLKDFTSKYDALSQEEKAHVNDLITQSIEQHATAKWPEILPRVLYLSTRDRERFPKEAGAPITRALNELIGRCLDLRCDFLAAYDKFDYCPLVLQAYSDRYCKMEEDARRQQVQAILQAIDPKPTSDFGFFRVAPISKYDVRNLEDILGFAHTITISLENAQDMPGRVGTHTFTRKNPETQQNEEITYDVRFVENFPMEVAEKIAEKLYAKPANSTTIILK